MSADWQPRQTGSFHQNALVYVIKLQKNCKSHIIIVFVVRDRNSQNTHYQ